VDAKTGKDKPKVQQPYMPPVPFPQRLPKYRLEAQYAKFMEVLKQLSITIPFTDALAQMPTYAKFLKDLLSSKRSLKDCRSVQLNMECSAVISRELPPKRGDPGKFTIPCTIGKAAINKALCDLGASVSLMPYTVFKRIGVGELKPTRMTLQLADSSTRLPLGIVEDVPVQVGKFFVPGDFVVVEMKEDKEVPIILGRPFLRTARTVIDTHEGTLTMTVGGEKVQFQVDKAMKYPNIPDECYRVDVLDEIDEKDREVQEDFLARQHGLLRYHSDFLSQFQGSMVSDMSRSETMIHDLADVSAHVLAVETNACDPLVVTCDPLVVTCGPLVGTCDPLVVTCDPQVFIPAHVSAITTTNCDLQESILDSQIAAKRPETVLCDSHREVDVPFDPGGRGGKRRLLK
jgi:hypothetical protein